MAVTEEALSLWVVEAGGQASAWVADISEGGSPGPRLSPLKQGAWDTPAHDFLREHVVLPTSWAH